MDFVLDNAYISSETETATNHGNENMLLPANEVIERLTADGISCYPTMLNGNWNQIIATDNPVIDYSVWFEIVDGMVEVDDDFVDDFPLNN